MLSIDGSAGEGGGQMLRTALGLSIATGMPFRIVHIRAGRPKPGLSAQHLWCVRAAEALCGLPASPASVGSTELEFHPAKPALDRLDLDIGTAGSATLLVQSLVPAADALARPLAFSIKGGTDVRWSPPADHAVHALAPALALLGVGLELRVAKRGYYPKGGGLLEGTLSPARFRPAALGRARDARDAYVHTGSLPAHVAERMAERVKELVPGVSIHMDVQQTESPGAGVTLVASGRTAFLAVSELGEKGIGAEAVAERCAAELARQLATGAAVDTHLADQLVPVMALNPGACSFTVAEPTEHLSTNILVAEKFTGRKFTVEKLATCTRVSTDDG